MAAKKQRKRTRILAWVEMDQGQKTTASKKVPGSNSALTHGKKGIKSQITWRPADAVSARRSFFGRLMAFAGKCLAIVVAIGAVLALAAVLIAVVAEGIAAGLAKVGEAISPVSQYLVIGAAVAAALASGVVAVKIVNAFRRSRARAAHRAALRRTAKEEATARAEQTRVMQVAQVSRATTIPADWYPDPWNATLIRYWGGSAWTEHVRALPNAAVAPEGWYPVPTDATRLRYWDGTAWTNHFWPRAGASLGVHSRGPSGSSRSRRRRS